MQRETSKRQRLETSVDKCQRQGDSVADTELTSSADRKNGMKKKAKLQQDG